MSLDVHAFTKTIEEKNLFSKSNRLVVGISGGVDSVVLCYLLHSAGFSFAMAHVNYGLRGNESEEDERFVRAFAKRLNKEVHVLLVNMSEAKELSGKGTQETARDVRYQWFRELSVQLNADRIITAHHLNDQTETIIHQFVRGGMVNALAGMKHKQNELVRPLLHFTKEQIIDFAQKNELSWREDFSNTKSDYTRNFIRHEIVPILLKMNPALHESFITRSAIMEEVGSLTDEVIDQQIAHHIEVIHETQRVRLDWILEYPYRKLFLWKWLQPAGFSSHQQKAIGELLHAQTGAHIDAGEMQLWKESDYLVLTSRVTSKVVLTRIDELPFHTLDPFNIEMTECGPGDVNHILSPYVLFLDLENIRFPMVLRTWAPADIFRPLGMSGRQKISDFLIQQKIPLRKKNDILVLLSNEDIIAIPGYRISDDHKITESTKRVLKIVFHPTA